MYANEQYAWADAGLGFLKDSGGFVRYRVWDLKG